MTAKFKIFHDFFMEGHVEIRFPNGGSCGNLISFQQCYDDFTNFLMYGNFTMTVTYTNSYRNINLKCSPCLLSIYSLTIVHSKVATDRTSDQSRIRSLDGKKSVNQKEMLGNVGSTLELAFYAKKNQICRQISSHGKTKS